MTETSRKNETHHREGANKLEKNRGILLEVQINEMQYLRSLSMCGL